MAHRKYAYKRKVGAEQYLIWSNVNQEAVDSIFDDPDRAAETFVAITLLVQDGIAKLKWGPIQRDRLSPRVLTYFWGEDDIINFKTIDQEEPVLSFFVKADAGTVKVEGSRDLIKPSALCAVCGSTSLAIKALRKGSKLKRCAGCPKRVSQRYCGRRCFKRAWKFGHRNDCNKLHIVK